ncbi:MAG: tetratricopeptide repeat protein, partial [Bacteroidales bacterium]|nr:tetratricopeptide repeat protein [Bacteroidales bacterium]
MDEIFNSLTKIGELGVIARTSVEQYRNTTKTIAEIGKELDVDYIVEGSGQKFGNTFRMRMQLIEVSTGLHIWSESFQHKIKMTRKLFRIQGRIAESIASELKTSLTAKEKKLLEKVPTSDISAYNLYTEANSIQDDIKSTSNDSAYRRAVKLYNAAIQADPSFARAYTGLASAYWNRYYYEKYFEKNYLDTCLIFAREALELDDQLDEAYFMQGEYYRIKGQHYEALQKYDKALDINPNYFQAYYRKGYLLIWVLGDYVKGLDNLHKALALIRGNGRSVILKSLGVTYRDAGFPEKAKYYFDEALILDGNEASYLGNIAFVEFSKGNFEEAVNLSKQKEKMDDSYNSLGYYCVIPDHKDEAYSEALKEAEKFKKSGTLSLQKSHRIGYAFWQAGKKKEAEYYFKQQIRYGEESIKLNREIEQRKAAQYDLAGTYAFLGDKVLAYKNLDEFAERNSFPLWWVTMIK